MRALDIVERAATICYRRYMSDDVRKLIVEFAKTLDGVGVSEHRSRYAELVAPGETPARVADMMRNSGCGLVARGLWRAAGIRHPRLDPPYKIGLAIADAVAIAHQADAIRSPRHVPAPGDAVLVGSGRLEHIYTVLRVYAQDWPTDGTTWLQALDGGQRDARGAQVCRVLDHDIAGDPPRDGARLVRCVIDFGAVARRFGGSEAGQL